MKVNETAVRVKMAERGIRNMSDLCRRSGVGLTTVREMLMGNPWKSTTLEALADALQCDPRELIKIEVAQLG